MKQKKQIDHVSNQKIIEVGKKIRSDVIKKHLNVPEKKNFLLIIPQVMLHFLIFQDAKKKVH